MIHQAECGRTGREEMSLRPGKRPQANMVGIMFAVLILATSVLFADPHVCSDIEGIVFPSGWDASTRVTYQVDVAEAACEWLDSRRLSVEEFLFDLDSMPFGLLFILH